MRREPCGSTESPEGNRPQGVKEHPVQRPIPPENTAKRGTSNWSDGAGLAGIRGLSRAIAPKLLAKLTRVQALAVDDFALTPVEEAG